ncbi:Sec-independent protein translocase subunit TatA [Corynebacterium sp. MSK151]|uniref:Sec-independent protein translocase subunit TatA n=1 Tax=unclassified Corynebacterium TaxID=2624378 RepID=UPI00254B7953|nr:MULTISPECIES: Sec-independent protein translocase subunit TatA [unclassified Corynebacterium]MDK8758837.1 Sec-independent protein translocase subunit TatA [Corynebacterium sp. MSK151]MDK8847972.1 Sec-independent protein translocase subunit TatA [Corynebacterium sp. MSK047]
MPNLGPWEIIIILVVLVLLFGAKKLPDAARSLGRSMRIFKSEVKEMRNDDAQQEQAAIQQAPQAQPQQPYQPQQQYQQPAPQAQPQQQYQPQPGQNNPGQPQQ